MLRVERGGSTHLLRFFVMKSAVMPLLGKSSSVGMKLVQIFDCDNIHSVNTQTLMPQNPPEVLSDHVLCQYSDVFNGIGEPPGNIQSKLNLTQFLLLTPLTDYQFP